MYAVSKAIIEAFDEISLYEILAAWLVTGNLTLAEALEGLAALGHVVGADTKEELRAACAKLEAENNQHRQAPRDGRQESTEILDTRLVVDRARARRRNAVVASGNLDDLAAAIHAQHPDFVTREFIVPQNGSRLRMLAPLEFSLVANQIRRLAAAGKVTRHFIYTSKIGLATKRYSTFAPDPCTQRNANALLRALKEASEKETETILKRRSEPSSNTVAEGPAPKQARRTLTTERDAIANSPMVLSEPSTGVEAMGVSSDLMERPTAIHPQMDWVEFVVRVPEGVAKGGCFDIEYNGRCFGFQCDDSIGAADEMRVQLPAASAVASAPALQCS